MTEYIVDGAEPNSTVLKSTTENGYEHERWLSVREEIVRCRDCRHYHAEINGCDEFGDIWHDEYANVEPDGFCAWGERKQS